MRSPFSRLDHRPTNVRPSPFPEEITSGTRLIKMKDITKLLMEVIICRESRNSGSWLDSILCDLFDVQFLCSPEGSAWMKLVPLLLCLSPSLPLFRRSLRARKEDCNQSWRNKHLSPRDDKKSQRPRTQGVPCPVSQWWHKSKVVIGFDELVILDELIWHFTGHYPLGYHAPFFIESYLR